MEVFKWGGNSIAFQLAVIKPKKKKKKCEKKNIREGVKSEI